MLFINQSGNAELIAFVSFTQISFWLCIRDFFVLEANKRRNARFLLLRKVRVERLPTKGKEK